jgi:hypothetical protein
MPAVFVVAFMVLPGSIGILAPEEFAVAATGR